MSTKINTTTTSTHSGLMDTRLAGNRRKGTSGKPLQYDFGYWPLKSLFNTVSDPGAEMAFMDFKSGDYVRIFSNVKAGDIAWKGEIDLDFESYIHETGAHTKAQALNGYWVHGVQRNEGNPEAWGRMFHAQLPAILQRKDKTVYGALEPFFETGTEGVLWSVAEYGVEGYDQLHCLEKGDLLTVFSTVTDGDIEWEGTLDFTDSPCKSGYCSEFVRTPRHMNPERFLNLLHGANPVHVTPAQG